MSRQETVLAETDAPDVDWLYAALKAARVGGKVYRSYWLVGPGLMSHIRTLVPSDVTGIDYTAPMTETLFGKTVVTNDDMPVERIELRHVAIPPLWQRLSWRLVGYVAGRIVWTGTALREAARRQERGMP